MFALFIVYMHGKGNLKNLYIKMRVRKGQIIVICF